MYFWLREDWTLDDTVIGTPDIGGDEIDFLIGAPLPKSIKTPIEFKTSYSSGAVAQHFFDYGTCIPAVSKAFVEVLVSAGVDNFELLPATLKNDAGYVWEDFFALNVIGMVNATDLHNPIYEEIMGGNEEGMPPLGVFTALALREERITPFDFFREPIGNSLVLSERVMQKVLDAFPNGGIGITAHEVILT
ncbi:hypothetical protein SAMN02745866_01724 [Alteromonadaceae bacterium Bs31]|nr:hypothetical protein SAMN02745866_01724 [Alteromonadaceae bacterium Bs31]